MLIIDSQSTYLPDACVASIGFFDGVHQGHLYLIDQVRRVALEKGLKSGLLTFPIPPAEVIFPDRKIPLLTPVDQKLERLTQTGVDYCFLLDFTLALSKLTAREFMKEILVDRCHVKVLIIGYDHRFGHNRSEGFEDYCRYGEELGIEIIQATALPAGEIEVSSSLIRSYIDRGEVELVEPVLGYSYELSGRVVRGKQLGRTIGFPTANISLAQSNKIIPKDGVYAVQVYIENNSNPYWGMLNIGKRPTVDDSNLRSIEVHILDFQGDIYGSHVRLLFIQRLRDEIKFSSIDKLVEQLGLDRKAVQNLREAR